MAKRKKNRPNLLVRMLDGVLSAVDWLCEGVSAVAVALLSTAGGLVFRLVRGMFSALLWAARLLLCVPAWALRRLTAGRNTAHRCLRLDGPEFEAYMALVLEDNGFKHVVLTKGSGDQGVDILAERGGKTYAIQCKNYAGAVGNFAVQEAYAGAEFYGCEVAAVVCPGTFTRGARELAGATGVQLWDGRKLSRIMRVSGRRPRHRN